MTREILRYKRGPYGSPYHFLDFSKGRGYAITNEEDFDKPDEELEREEQSIGKNVLAIKGLGQFERFKAASAFRILIENWHVSDFHINLARGSKDAAGFNEHLSVTGDNLQLVARNIYENHRDIFEKIVAAMKRRVPGIRHIETVPTPDGRLLLSFQDGAFTDPFIDRYVSDGTIKIFAYLVLLYDPEPHPLLCVEEPENQLYPKLQPELAEEFRHYASQGGQVFVSTHSPDFLNAIDLDEVFWLVKDEGYTHIKRARDDAQVAAFMAGGDQMGYLWKQGFFEGGGSAMRELVFFLEEPSAKEMLNGLLPKLLDANTRHLCIDFEGKQDLEKQLEKRLRNWCNPNARFVVLRDQDSADCVAVKQRLTAICEKAGRPHSLVRIACHELESWYLGDLQAVETGLELHGLSRQQRKKKFRNPDKLSNAKQELKTLTKNNYQPISGSREIGPCLSVDNNLSHSFNVFVAGIQRILNQEACL